MRQNKRQKKNYPRQIIAENDNTYFICILYSYILL